MAKKQYVRLEAFNAKLKTKTGQTSEIEFSGINKNAVNV